MSRREREVRIANPAPPKSRRSRAVKIANPAPKRGRGRRDSVAQLLTGIERLAATGARPNDVATLVEFVQAVAQDGGFDGFEGSLVCAGSRAVQLFVMEHAGSPHAHSYLARFVGMLQQAAGMCGAEHNPLEFDVHLRWGADDGDSEADQRRRAARAELERVRRPTSNPSGFELSGPPKTVAVCDGKWDAADAKAKVWKWATRPNGTLDARKAAKAFMLFDPSKAGTKGAYKLPVATVRGGKLVVVGNAVRNALSRLPQTLDVESAKAVRSRLDALLDRVHRSTKCAR